MPDPVLSAQWDKLGVWTSLGAPRAASIKRGKSRALDAIGPGTMVLTLPNAARQLDPAHTPAVAGLRPGVRVRLQATYNGTTYDLFTGNVERISHLFGEVNSPRDAVMILEAVDGLAVLAAAVLPSAFELAMRDHTPRAWLRMGEDKGPLFADRAGTGSRWGWGVGNIDYGVAALIAGSDDGAATFPDDRASYMLTFPGFLPASNTWTLSFTLFVPTPLPTVAQYIFYDARGDMGLGCYIGTDGRLTVHFKSTTGAVIASVTGETNVVGNTYQVNVVSSPGLALKIYIGDYYDNRSSVGTAPDITASANSHLVWGLTGSEGSPITLDEIVVFDYALTVSQLFELEQSVGGWVGFGVADRFDRVLKGAGWDTTQTVVGNVDEDGINLRGFEPSGALDYLNQIATTIEGRLWATPDGKIRLLSRNEHVEGIYAASAAELTDVPGGLGYRGIGRYGEDWDTMANVVRRINGESTIVASDQASIDAYGLHDRSAAAEVESLFATTERDFDLAAFRLAHYSKPATFVDGLELAPRANAALWPHVLGLDLGRRITFRRTPQGVGSALVHETIIEGIEHDIGPKKWTTKYSVDASGAQRYFRFDNTLWDAADWRFTA